LYVFWCAVSVFKWKFLVLAIAAILSCYLIYSCLSTYWNYMRSVSFMDGRRLGPSVQRVTQWCSADVAGEDITVLLPCTTRTICPRFIPDLWCLVDNGRLKHFQLLILFVLCGCSLVSITSFLVTSDFLLLRFYSIDTRLARFCCVLALFSTCPPS
jgi:hypothetical protein